MSNRLLSLAAAAAVTLAIGAPAFAQDIQFELINNSALTVMEFYTSAANDPNWGEDILGADVVAPGTTGVVTIADGSDQCVYDMQFVFEDGQVLEDQVDICQLASYTLQ